MTRGNQRQIDREKARKKNSENKKGEKSDFFKNKETHAQIMRQKQKKHEVEVKPGNGGNEYQKKQEE